MTATKLGVYIFTCNSNKLEDQIKSCNFFLAVIVIKMCKSVFQQLKKNSIEPYYIYCL